MPDLSSHVNLIRPGREVSLREESWVTLYPWFTNSALANLAIQKLLIAGVPSDQLGVLTPDHLPKHQGMILIVPCPTPMIQDRVQTICTSLGVTWLDPDSPKNLPDAPSKPETPS